jgi:predicted Ser/Thr protein kinase
MSSFDATATAINRTHSPDLIPGYRLENLVGTGGMGEVHKATQLSLGRTVAIKLLSAQLAQDESFVARFQKEAAALATLHHPNIVSILDKGRTPTTYYLVMEFVDGPSLREWIRAPQHDVPETLRTMVEICRAIDYAHKRGVIHRDLKPENILFDAQAGGLAKVTDFGLASFLDDASARFDLTSTHVAMGTLSYMAPEQRVDAKNADGRADIFALGLILYEMLVGELPVGNFDPPSHRRPGVDPRLDGIIARCLKQTPAERYPTVTALIADLEPLFPNLTSLRPVKLSRMQRLGLALKRLVRTIFQVVSTLVVLAALGVLGVAWLRLSEKRVPVLPGAALTADLGPPSVQHTAGRLHTGGTLRKVAVGEGPDSLSMLVAGRPLDSSSKTLVFTPVEGQSRVGLARVDVVGLEGDTLRFTARVSAEGPAPTPLARARALLYGTPPDPEAALMLLGSPGRYVALVHNGAGAPLRLEWALGERRGTQLWLASPAGPTDLELEVSEQGVLVASVGRGSDKRTIGEPLHLGPEWHEQFGEKQPGEVPTAAFGCIEGTCRADNLVYQVKRVPPAPPPVAAPPREELVPAKAVVPPTPKRPAPAPAPAPKVSAPSKTKRSK